MSMRIFNSFAAGGRIAAEVFIFSAALSEAGPILYSPASGKTAEEPFIMRIDENAAIKGDFPNRKIPVKRQGGHAVA